MRVFQTLSDIGVNYLIPTQILSTEREVIDTMEADGREVAVEWASANIKTGSHPMRF